MNNQSHTVGGGTRTLAKARFEQQQALLARQAAQAKKLAEARKPQADKAREYTLFGKPVDSMDPTRPARMVFETALELFLTAVKDSNGKKGATAVAVDAAADQHSDLFEDPQTQADALRGADWASAALKWAGRKIFDQTPAQPVEVKELASV